MMLKKSNFLVLSILPSVVAGVLLLATLPNPNLLRSCLVHVSYYIILLLFMTWLFILIKYLKTTGFSLKSIGRPQIGGIIFSVTLTALIFISVGCYFRVLADEANLVAVSKSMLYDKTTYNSVMGNWWYFNFSPITQDLEKRPFLFSFLTYVIHVLIGYHAFNPFVLNFILFASLCLLIFILIQIHFGSILAFAAVLLFAAQPIVTQTATSAGFDILSVFFTFICFVSLYFFLKEPSASRFELLWVNFLMLCHTRYESFFFFGIALFFLFLFKYLRFEYFQNSLIYGLTPIFFLPLIWQRLAIPWIHQFQNKPGEAAFAFDYFLKNTAFLSKALFQFDYFLPYATVINLIGMIALGYFIYLALLNRWPRENWQKHLSIISATYVLFLWVFLTSYLMGNLDQPAMARFFSLFFVLLSLLAFLLLTRIPFLNQNPIAILLIAISAFLFYHPISIDNRFSNAQVLPREYRHVMAFLKKQGHQNFRLIASKPGLYTIHNYGTVSFELANVNKDRILDELNRHLYTEIFVVQEIEYATQAPSKGTTLDPLFSLKPLFEIQVAHYFIRISRVTNFDLSPSGAENISTVASSPQSLSVTPKQP